MVAEREIRAFYTNDFIRVYQAFNNSIADSAIKNKQFVCPPFKTERTTWIKPSFLWMMYRSGWATKSNQERVLAIDITYNGFEWALRHSCLSHFDKMIYENEDNWKNIRAISPVVIQWDPERDIFLNKLPQRTIQIGLLPESSKLYISKWIINISDMTEIIHEIKSLIDKQKLEEARKLLPEERVYPITTDIKEKIGVR